MVVRQTGFQAKKNIVPFAVRDQTAGQITGVQGQP